MATSVARFRLTPKTRQTNMDFSLLWAITRHSVTRYSVTDDYSRGPGIPALPFAPAAAARLGHPRPRRDGIHAARLHAVGFGLGYDYRRAAASLRPLLVEASSVHSAVSAYPAHTRRFAASAVGKCQFACRRPWEDKYKQFGL